jgi:hypothetical protein
LADADRVTQDQDGKSAGPALHPVDAGKPAPSINAMLLDMPRDDGVFDLLKLPARDMEA